MFRSIKDGAVFISDAHANEKNQDNFFLLLEKIVSINPPQLFLMGDIFDLLVGEINLSIDENINLIKKIDFIAKTIPTYYFEGNHDFNLENIFKNITIFNRANQPQFFYYKDIKIALSHGDLWATKGYEIYINFIQNRTVLKTLNLINSALNGYLTKKIKNYNYSKNLCKKIKEFEKIVKKRVENYEGVDLVIEGHFHQDIEFEFNNLRYINLPSYGCNKKFAIFKNKRFNSLSL